jgi:serine-type D-Ala-D-Ala carboxypeptidase (penicillin-binding protein 5/6)
MNRLLSLLLLLMFCLVPAPAGAAPAKTGKPKPAPAKPAPPRPTVAREPYLGAIVVDAADGRVLFEENADAQGYPASVLKLMLLLTTVEQIKAGTLTLKDAVPVNPTAVSSEGADLKLKAGESFTVEDMLYACMMHSANDAAMALAEKLSGSQAAYLQHINQRAQALGMKNSRFLSPSGLGLNNGAGPHDVTTPRDLSLLCLEVLKHPEALTFTAARSRVFRPGGGKNRIRMATHNYILDMVKGCDGLKTGYLHAAGYCIAGTARRGERRILTVILGATSEKSRNQLAAKLLEKGFATPRQE